MQCCFGALSYFSRIIIAYPYNFVISFIFIIPLIVIALPFLLKLIRCKANANAKIVRLIPLETDPTRNNTMFLPEYSYEYKGEQHTRTAKKYAGGTQYEIGSVVKLRIDPEHPDTFIDLKRELYVNRIVIIFSIIAFIIGIGIFLSPTESLSHYLTGR